MPTKRLVVAAAHPPRGGCPCCARLLKKTASTVKPIHQCKLLQNAQLEYSLVSAAKFAPSTPCTNRPVQCPKCDFVVWSYSMGDHFAERHPTMAIPKDLATDVALRYHEREATEQLLQNYPRSVKVKSCQGVKCLCKTKPNA